MKHERKCPVWVILCVLTVLLWIVLQPHLLASSGSIIY